MESTKLWLVVVSNEIIYYITTNWIHSVCGKLRFRPLSSRVKECALSEANNEYTGTELIFLLQMGKFKYVLAKWKNRHPATAYLFSELKVEYSDCTIKIPFLVKFICLNIISFPQQRTDDAESFLQDLHEVSINWVILNQLRMRPSPNSVPQNVHIHKKK